MRTVGERLEDPMDNKKTVSLWQRFRDWLFPPPEPKPQPLDKFDVEPIAKELQLREEARRLSEGGTSAVLVSGVEAAIAARVDKGRQLRIDDADNRLASLAAELALVDVTTLVDGALQTGDEFRRTVDAYLDRQRPALAKLGEDVCRADAELKEFRERNGLARSARYPTPRSKRWMKAALPVFVVFEASINAFLFASGLDSGLIGGFSAAAILATLNVGVAFLFGYYAIRNLFHRNIVRKCLGGFSVLAAVLSMLCVSFAIAHYRVALVADVNAPDRVALETLLSSPFGLHDFWSWVLVAVSFGFALLSLLDGFAFDDRYPDYGPHDRTYQEAIGAYNRGMRTVWAAIQVIKTELVKKLEDAEKEARARVATHEANIAKRRAAADKLERALGEADRCLTALVHLFRAEIKLNQKDRSLVLDFPAIPAFQAVRVPDFQIDETRASLAPQKAKLQRLLDEQFAIKAAVESGFLDKFDALRSIDDHFLKSATVHSHQQREGIAA
jgi:hypothetical protein